LKTKNRGQICISCKILIEDEQGVLFFRELVHRLKNSNFIPSNLKIDVDAVIQGGPCNFKQTRVIKTTVNSFNKVILIFDADGPDKIDLKRNQMKIHIPKDKSQLIDMIILDYEIEEWICKSLDISIGDKPSIELDKYLKKISKGRKSYHKSDLHSFSKVIDFDKLQKNPNYSFKIFINSLNSIPLN